jgi:CRP-like cAMP-binding protein
LAAIDNEPRSAGIIAVTDVTVARMPSSVFRTAVHSYPDVCDQLLALLASQIRIGRSKRWAINFLFGQPSPIQLPADRIV